MTIAQYRIKTRKGMFVHNKRIEFVDNIFI